MADSSSDEDGVTDAELRAMAKEVKGKISILK